MRVFQAILALLVLGSATLASAADSANSATVGLRLAFEPASLDWTLGDVPIHVINNVTEGLFRLDASGIVVPDEAEGLPRAIRPPGTWRIKLRHDLHWSDGKPVTAADYVAAWHRLKDPATGSTYSFLLSDIESVKAVGDDTLEVLLHDRKAKAFPTSTLTHWATYPVRADLIAAHPSGWGSRPAEMAFNGPYVIETYDRETRLVLVPNTKHRAPGTLARVEALIVADDSTALRLFDSGRLHFLPELNTLERESLKARPDYRSRRSPILVYAGVAVQTPELQSSAARRALSQAIDRTLIPKLLASDCAPATGLTPGTTTAPLARPTATVRFDSTTLELGYYEKGLNRTLVEFLQDQWHAHLGLSTSLKSNEVKSYWTKLAQAPYPIFLNSYSPPVPDEIFYYRLLVKGNPMNMGRWNDAEYDRAVARRDFRAADAIVREQMPIIPLYFRAYDYLMSPKLSGAELNPMMSLDLSRARLRTD